MLLNKISGRKIYSRVYAYTNVSYDIDRAEEKKLVYA